MTAWGWLLLGLATLAWPRHRPAGRAAIRSGAARGAARVPAGERLRRDRVLGPVAGLGVAAIVVVMFGPSTGPVLAAIAGPAAGAGAEWLRRRPERHAADSSLALCLDLVAAVLRSGRPVAAALATAAPSAGEGTAAALLRVARLLELGADPREAWSACAGRGSTLEPVAAVAVRSQASGIKLADAFERLAADLREDRAARAAARAHRAGVHAMAPLAACFLPSFVCLGIVPVVVGIARTALRTVG